MTRFVAIVWIINVQRVFQFAETLSIIECKTKWKEHQKEDENHKKWKRTFSAFDSRTVFTFHKLAIVSSQTWMNICVELNSPLLDKFEHTWLAHTPIYRITNKISVWARARVLAHVTIKTDTTYKTKNLESNINENETYKIPSKLVPCIQEDRNKFHQWDDMFHRSDICTFGCIQVRKNQEDRYQYKFPLSSQDNKNIFLWTIFKLNRNKRTNHWLTSHVMTLAANVWACTLIVTIQAEFIFRTNLFAIRPNKARQTTTWTSLMVARLIRVETWRTVLHTILPKSSSFTLKQNKVNACQVSIKTYDVLTLLSIKAQIANTIWIIIGARHSVLART